MRKVAALIVVFILALSGNAQKSDPPLPPATTNTTTAIPNTAESAPLGKSGNINVGQDEYRKKYKELLDSLALKNESEPKQNFNDLSTSYRYAIYGMVAAGIIICALLGIVYGLYHKNKSLKNELDKLK